MNILFGNVVQQMQKQYKRYEGFSITARNDCRSKFSKNGEKMENRKRALIL
jgi:hypothetical protein